MICCCIICSEDVTFRSCSSIVTGIGAGRCGEGGAAGGEDSWDCCCGAADAVDEDEAATECNGGDVRAVDGLKDSGALGCDGEPGGSVNATRAAMRCRRKSRC